MVSFLMSQGLYRHLSEDAPTVPTLQENGKNAAEVAEAETKLKAWKDDDAKAMGMIRLRLAPPILQLVRGETTAQRTWNELTNAFATATLGQAFTEFKGILETVIPDNQSPAAAVSKVKGHVERLSQLHVEVDEYIHLMLLIVKTPKYAEHVATQTMMTQTMHDTTADDATGNPDPDAYGRALINAWEQRKLASSGRQQRQGDANRATGIRRAGRQPRFNEQQQQQPQQQRPQGQQQQQQGNGNRGKRGRRGRGRKGRDNDNEQHGHSHVAAIATSGIAPPPPQVPAPKDPKPPLESRIEGVREVASDGNQYPRFKRALKLARDIDVSTSFERIRVLEGVVDSNEQIEFEEGSSRPSKRVRLTPEPIDWASEVSNEERERAVSLGTSDDDADGDEDVDNDILETIGYYGDRYVASDSTRIIHTNPPSPATTSRWIERIGSVVLDSHLYNELNLAANELCEHKREYNECRRCKGKGKAKTLPYMRGIWMLDSGASQHFAGDKSLLMNPHKVDKPVEIHTANGVVMVDTIGDCEFKYRDPSSGELLGFYLQDVVYMPTHNDGLNLISLGQLLNEGMTVRGRAGEIIISDERENVDVLHFRPRWPGDTVYILYTMVDRHEQAQVSYDIAHRRFAHPGKEVLQRLPSAVHGFPEVVGEPSSTPCSGCAQGKMPNRPFPPSKRRAKKPFELIHSDLKDFPVESYHRYKYIITFYDDYTSHGWIILMRKKSYAINATKQFLAMVETQYHAKVEGWMSDAGGEYKSDAFITMLKDKGINILTSAPHTPQQNGRAERFNRTIMDKAEAMRFTACIPQSWWEFAVQHAVHLYNRTPQRRLQWETPFEVLNGEKPSVKHLRVFGCGAWVFIPSDVRKTKLSPKAELMTYLGTTDHGDLFMRAPNNVIFTSSHAEFDEEFFPKCPDNKGKTPERPKRQPRPPSDHNGNDHSNDPRFDDDDDDAPPRPAPRHNPPPSERRQRQRDDDRPDAPQRRSASPPPPRREPAPVDQPQPRRGTRTRKPVNRPDNVYGSSRSPVDIERSISNIRQWERDVGLAPLPLHSKPPTRQSTPVPDIRPASPLAPEDIPPDFAPGPDSSSDVDNTFQTAVSDEEMARLCREGGVQFFNYLLAQAVEPHGSKSNVRDWTYRDIARLPRAEQEEWRAACREELDALRKRGVFDLVERPKGKRVVKNRWVFDIKSDGRKKARLVARGYSQVEGIDYDKIFSPVVRYETVRLVLALAALEGYHLSGLDVRNAYLYGDLEEEIYMDQPDGFVAKGKEHMVLRLRKALYGLKQAGLTWWRTLSKSMAELGFKRLKSDAGVYVKYDGKDRIIVVVYVDDAIFAGRNKAKVLRAKGDFMKRWECRDLGDLKEFLRMRITRIGSRIILDQRAYLDKVIERCGQKDAKPVKTPLPEGYMPKPHEGEVDLARRRRFQVVIGSLLYLMLGTRPDIAFAVTKLAQYSANPSEDHLNRALYICRYLQDTRDYTLEYDGSSGLGLVAYTDADWGADPKRRSQTGYLIKLAGGAFVWSSYAQKSVARSTKDAEYMALSDCSREVMWVRNIFLELGYKFRSVPICSDNQGALFVSENPVTEKRTKHIDIRYHYIRDVIEQGYVEVLFVPGMDNPADIFTKNLGLVKIRRFRPMLGLKPAAETRDPPAQA